MSDFANICPRDISNCTFSTCPKECAKIAYLPSLAGNLAILAIFTVLLLGQIGLGVWYRTWGFLVGMVCGLVLEIIGYAGRVMLHNNPFDFDSFLIYLIPLTIGPAFLTGAIYLCLSRVVIVNGQSLSRLSPRVFSIMFMVFEFVSLLLQAVGGALAATADDKASLDMGCNIMVAGLIWQVVSLGIFMAIWADFILRCSKAGEESGGQRLRNLRTGCRRFRWFQYSLWTATILIFIRSIYRVVELQDGFDGTVANNQTGFMVFEGPMILLATGLLTVWHPGYAFAGHWSEAVWSLSRNRSDKLAKELSLESVPSAK